jgi:hypothetical protein
VFLIRLVTDEGYKKSIPDLQTEVHKPWSSFLPGKEKRIRYILFYN